MTRYRNQREADEDAELERELADMFLKQNGGTESQAPEPKVVVIDQPTEKKEDDVDWKARYAELRRHEQQKEANYKAELNRLNRQLEGISKGTIKPPKSEAEIDEWKEAYPEFADVLEAWIDKAVSTKTADLRRKAAQAEQEKAILKLKEKHPDCVKILQSDEFKDWMVDQSATARETIYNSYDVKGAAFILDRFKAEKGISKSVGGAKDNDDDVSAAKAVKVKGNPSLSGDTDKEWEFSESQIERETARNPKWWDANEEKIMDAHRRRKILRDLSGGAGG